VRQGTASTSTGTGTGTSLPSNTRGISSSSNPLNESGTASSGSSSQPTGITLGISVDGQNGDRDQSSGSGVTTPPSSSVVTRPFTFGNGSLVGTSSSGTVRNGVNTSSPFSFFGTGVGRGSGSLLPAPDIASNPSGSPIAPTASRLFGFGISAPYPATDDTATTPPRPVFTFSHFGLTPTVTTSGTNSDVNANDTTRTVSSTTLSPATDRSTTTTVPISTHVSTSTEQPTNNDTPNSPRHLFKFEPNQPAESNGQSSWTFILPYPDIGGEVEFISGEIGNWAERIEGDIGDQVRAGITFGLIGEERECDCGI
jgi:hypothetical protein